jgi:hypothetical protein
MFCEIQHGWEAPIFLLNIYVLLICLIEILSSYGVTDSNIETQQFSIRDVPPNLPLFTFQLHGHVHMAAKCLHTEYIQYMRTEMRLSFLKLKT